MDKKMVFTGFDDNSFFKVGNFTVGNEYTAMSDDRARWPDDISSSDGDDGFFIDDNGSYVWESLSSFKLAVTNKTVRPIMTVEARDALNKFHESTGLENRSDSILALTSLPSDHSFLSRETTRLTGECFDLSLGKGRIKGSLTKAKKEARQWKLIALSMTAACIALIATMMITAS